MADRGQIEEIKSKLDIVQVVSKYVPTLKKRGTNYFGLCPFHNEKTPSFAVNEELQIFKCFGCGEGGDVIKFLQKIEGLDFPSALERSAHMAGIELKKDVYKDKKYQKLYEKRKKLLSANKFAIDYFHYLLLEHKIGEVARRYAKKRKIPIKILKEYKIGYAPDGFDNLKKFLVKKGFSLKELVDFGLLVNKNGHIYDKFRDRLMFPIFNIQGDVIGFSGRILNKNALGPKYLNSPETLIYQKKKNLYGLYQAKEEIRKKDFVILVEGNIDILSSAKIDFKNIVCPLGTALTLEQCQLISRYTKNVYLAFDSDEAGKKAIVRSLALLDQLSINVKVLNLHGFQDVDELIRNNENLWSDVVKNPIEVFDYLINTFKQSYDLGNIKDKLRFIDNLKMFINSLHDKTEIEEYIKKIAIITQLDIQDIKMRFFDDTKVEDTNFLVRNLQDVKDVSFKKVSDKGKKKFLASFLIQSKEDLNNWEFLHFIYSKWFLKILKEIKINGKKNIQSLDKNKQTLFEELFLYDIGDDFEFSKRIALNVYKFLAEKNLLRKIDKTKKLIEKLEYEGSDASNQLLQVQELIKVLKKLKDL